MAKLNLKQLRTLMSASFFVFGLSSILLSANDDEHFPQKPSLTNPVYEAVRADKNFECLSAKEAKRVTVGDFETCFVDLNCKYIPSPTNPKSKIEPKDYSFYRVCLPEGNSCPTFDSCTKKREGETFWVGATTAITSKNIVTNGENDKEYGTCKYDTLDLGADGLYAETDEDLFLACSGKANLFLACSGKAKCTGGTKEFPSEVVTCGPLNDEVREIERKQGNQTVVSYHPVCPGPVTCLKNTLPSRTVPTIISRRKTNASKSTRETSTPTEKSSAGKKTH